MFDSNSRREYLRNSGVAIGAITGLAGCLGEDTTEEETGGGSDSDGGDSETDREYPEWNLDDPEMPQLASTLIEDDFWTGFTDDLDDFEERDEPRYGGPVWEHPDDEDEWIEPEELVFTVDPADDPAAYEDTMDALIENLENETGLPVRFLPVDSYAAQVEAMRAERLHTALFATGNTPFAVNLAGAVPFAMPVGDEQFGGKNWMLTHVDSDIWEMDDLRDQTLAHSDPSSGTGNLTPRALYEERFDIVPGEDYDVEWSGSHDASILGVYHEDYDAAPTTSIIVERLARQGEFDPDDIRVIFSSQVFPMGPFCYRYNLHPDIIEGIRAAHLDYDYRDTQVYEDMNFDEFVEIDYATHWDDMLLVHEANDVEYDLDEL